MLEISRIFKYFITIETFRNVQFISIAFLRRVSAKSKVYSFIFTSSKTIEKDTNKKKKETIDEKKRLR